MQGLVFLIPIVAIVMSLGIPIVAIIADAMKRRRLYDVIHRERLAAIEKGIELPPLPTEYFESNGRPRRPRYLLKGLIWLFIGIAATIAIFVHEGLEEALFALIPTGVGLAYLIYYLVEGRREETEFAAEPTASRLPDPGMR